MYRVGIGYDVHAFDNNLEDDAKIYLCGVQIPHKYRVIAHSDGDVALHAITDALLGSVAEGSIGVHFPPTDIKWKNASSEIFVRYAYELLTKKGYKIQNLDLTIICQAPKIMPYALDMRRNLSSLLNLNLEQINVKAVTTEGLGAIGRGEGVATQVIVMVKKALQKTQDKA